jgi:hypothetical protein
VNRGFFSRITILSICGEFSEEADGAARIFRATNFDLRRRARTIRLEKISALSLSRFEYSQNLNVSPRIDDTFVLAQLRNYQFPLPQHVGAAAKGMHASIASRRRRWLVFLPMFAASRCPNELSRRNFHVFGIPKMRK